MGVDSGSRTRKGTLPADRGASAAAAPAASAASPPPASSVEPPVLGAVVPQAAAGVPSPATVSPPHVCAAEVTGAIGTPPSETAAGVVGAVGWPWWYSPDRTVAWGGDDPVGEFREPALSPHRLQLLKLRVGRTDGSGLLRRCRLSQASCDEELEKDRLLELEVLNYSDVEVGYDPPFPLEGWV